MRKIFIADAHLRHPEDDNYRKLLRFLSRLPDDTDSLIILGDLFEFWIGYPPGSFPQYIPVLEELMKLRLRGIQIIYFEGNHDFHLGSYFEKQLGAAIYTTGATLDLEGKSFYLCHGDQINRRDYGYRIMRAIFHSSLTRNLTRIVPASVPKKIAAILGSKSKSHHEARRVRWDFTRMLREFAREKFSSGCDVVMSGHFHTPLKETSGDGGGQKILISLGDWITHFSYAELSGGELQLKIFKE